MPLIAATQKIGMERMHDAIVRNGLACSSKCLCHHFSAIYTANATLLAKAFELPLGSFSDIQ